ncbi:MAG TPA: type IV pilus twitching motility protein PilT [Acidimicrobiales bacterium]|nr:type IV pilus twitching motility protein PilT [Acidimicrobiales bacterium]
MGPSPSHVDPLLAAVWAQGGTDLLITAGSAPLVRVDGYLTRLSNTKELDGHETERVIAGVLGKELYEQFRRTKQVDFAFTWADKARVRGNAFFQKGTVALSLRLIPYEIPSPVELGLPPSVAEWLKLPKGLVLVTGPTGSGKSTTLAAMIDHINLNRAVHIITIEDPIEYVHMHKRSAVNQREVGGDCESFAAALKAALREDPDVVLVGEMRDPESISAALTIAETGHLVFATLHTNDTAQSLDRIVDVFPAAQQPQVRLQLTHTLVGILNQALVPRIGGGRVAAFEIMVATNAVKNLIREGKTRQIRNLVATGQKGGMQTLEAALSDLVLRGDVAYEEAILWTMHPEEVQRPAAPPPPLYPAALSAN